MGKQRLAATGQGFAPHPHYLHGIRVLLAGFLLVAVFLVRLGPSGLQAVNPIVNVNQTGSHSVLAYATNLNHGELLSATNAYRAQNGLGPLSLHSQLNSSAQMKAQHMIDHDYWAHVAPDGTQPWYFFTQAGYNYTTAGENLAYGFDNSAATVDAWFGSPSHRDNILGNYADVGFGFVNGPSYQGGQYTVVVAHYGKTAAAPPAPAPAPAPAPPAPAPTPVIPAAQPEPAPAPESPPSEPAPAAPTDEEAAPEKADDDTEATPAGSTESKPGGGDFRTGEPQNISVLQRLAAAQPPAAAIASLGMTVSAVAGYAFTHRSLFRLAVASGEKFVVTHPLVDTAVIGSVAMLILTANAGFIG